MRERGSNVQVSDMQQAEKGTLQSYKLRHFLTGKVLSLQSFSIRGKETLCPCLSKDDQLDQQSRAQFISTQADDKEYILLYHHLHILTPLRTVSWRMVNATW